MTFITVLLWCLLTYWIFGNFLTFVILNSGDNGFLGIRIEIPEDIDLKDRVIGFVDCAFKMPVIAFIALINEF